MKVTWITRQESHAVVQGKVVQTKVVLDIGPGIRPQGYFKPQIHICVEPYLPYIERLRQDMGDDAAYVFQNCTWDKAMELLPERSVDTVFALDVLEHFEKEEGFRFLKEASRVARRQIIVFTPLGLYPQTYDGTSDKDRWGMNGAYWQAHRSGWYPEDFGDDWEFVCCKKFHFIDENEKPLKKPVGAIWAFRNLDMQIKKPHKNSKNSQELLIHKDSGKDGIIGSNDRSYKLIRGEELFSEGFFENAKKYFMKLANGPNPCKEALNNLGVLAYKEGNFNEAVHYFVESMRIDPLYEDAVANYSELLEAIKREKAASGTTSDERADNGTIHNQKVSDERFESADLSGRRVRIAVLCLPGLETFLGDIVRFLQSRYEVRTCYSRDGAELESAVRWADLIWLEWANQLAEGLTHREGLLEGKRVICRVHSYEVLDGYLQRVNWSKISKTIFVAPHVLDIARRIYPRMMDLTSTAVIPNGVDLDKYSFKERAPGFTLAVVGHVNNKKNPSLWPEIMDRLVRIDDRYRIKIAGAVQEVRYGLYLEHAFKRLGLEKHVQFFGHVENIPKWFESENVNYLLTTSIFEAFGYGIAEAMAMGYRPLINYFPGADGLWPAECLFSSVDDLVRLISDDGAYKPSEYRRFVEERYALPQQMTKIEELITSVMESVYSSKSIPTCSPNFSGTQSYWQNRYGKGGTSGSGSYGRLAQFKAEILNKYVVENNIRSVLELGCGDGHQLSLFEFPLYIGMDISAKAVSLCRELFKKDLRKHFFLYEPFKHEPDDPWHKADLAISLDVIYHLIEDELYEMYMKHLFAAAKRYVVIYSSNAEIITPSAHEKRRKFTSWIEVRQPDFKLVAHIPNRFPYDPSNPENTSLSDFYFFEKVKGAA